MITAIRINWPRSPNFNWLQLSCLLAGSAFATWRLAHLLLTRKRHRKMKHLIDKKRNERDSVIENLKFALISADKDILEKRKWINSLSTSELAENLQSEELTPTEVLEAFQLAAIIAHEKTNCVTEFISEAKKWCGQLEEEYAGKKKPALYGIPFSVKESVGVKGHDATAGMGRFLFAPLQEDSVLVARLRQLGAVPFVLTNVPQTLLSYGCSNPIFGSTTNPRNNRLSPGGSSGGEGALLSLRGSVFGIGTDLAGSIRIPSHFCGIVGLKPCMLRLSLIGGRKLTPGRTTVAASFGPMANDVETLALFMENVLDDDFFAMDTYTVPLRFRRDLYESDKKLTIGYYDFDGFIEAVPACRRAVKIAKEILEQRGHRLVKFDVPEIYKFYKLVLRVLFIDGGHHYLHGVLHNEIIDPTLAKSILWYKTPTIVKRLIASISNCLGASKLGLVLDAFETETRDLAATFASVFEYKSRFNAEWKNLRLDAIICPPAAGVSMPSDFQYSHSTKLMPSFAYSVLFNLLDFPAGVVPVTKANADDEKAMQKYRDDEYFAKLIKNHNKNTVGSPVGVQCVALTYNEEICLKVMKEIENGVKERKTFEKM